MIAIVDYGVGNIFSLYSSFKFIGVDVCLTNDIQKIKDSEKIILPGVGAFKDAAQKLKETRLGDIVAVEAQKGKPLLGICLGMQMMFDKSFEYGEHEGLGLIEGNVVPTKDVIGENLKVPHIGWNELDFPKNKEKSKLFKYINEKDFVYFVHSFYAKDCDKNVIATSFYGADLTAAVEKDNIFGAQFHPEKSGNVGLNILKAFSEI